MRLWEVVDVRQDTIIASRPTECNARQDESERSELPRVLATRGCERLPEAAVVSGARL